MKCKREEGMKYYGPFKDISAVGCKNRGKSLKPSD
jgi:hypothetical protein